MVPIATSISTEVGLRGNDVQQQVEIMSIQRMEFGRLSRRKDSSLVALRRDVSVLRLLLVAEFVVMHERHVWTSW